MTWVRLSLPGLLVVAGVATAVLAPAWADAPLPSGTRVEGEARTSDAGVCGRPTEVVVYDIDADGETGHVLWFPGSGCWATWDLATLHPVRQVLVRGAVGDVAQCGRFTLWIDGAEAGRSSEDCNRDGLQTVQLASGLDVPAGEHVLRVEFTSEPSSSGAIDHLVLRAFEEPVPDPVRCHEATVRATSGGDLEATWEPIPGSAYYEVFVGPSEQPGHGWHVYQVDAPETSFTFTDAVPGTSYDVVVWGRGGRTIFGSTCLVTATAVPDLPTPLAGALLLGVGLAGFRWLRRAWP